jgi:D-alanyl-D-alanine carboxypeptidase/D-alanyl-D-alanine-endopeptidase (penicillin-binding protein 4)
MPVRRTTRRGVALAIAACLSLGAKASVAQAGDALPAAPAPVVLTPIDPATATGAAPTAAGVARAIDALTSSGPGGYSIVVVDPSRDVVLYDKKSSRPRTPASTAKIATSAAALAVLGPQTRLATVAYRLGDVVYLVGGGDPTLVRAHGGNPLAGGSASLRDLANASAAELDAGASVRLVYDDTAFRGPRLGPGWSSSYPAAGVAAPVTALVVDGGRVRPGSLSRVADPARQAADAFAGYLRDAGLTVTGIGGGRRDASASEIARVESPPIGVIVQRMLTDSENNYAEALAHLTGAKLLGKPTFAGGAAATEKALTSLGYALDGVHLVDGSGLSTMDLLPARLLADVLAHVARGDQPTLAAIGSGLAVAGLTGTLADRYDTPQTVAGRGFVHAKTGTLTGVVSLAGTVQDDDGRVLVFAMIANGVGSLDGVRDRMDQIASRLAGCGCS